MAAYTFILTLAGLTVRAILIDNLPVIFTLSCVIVKWCTLALALSSHFHCLANALCSQSVLSFLRRESTYPVMCPILTVHRQLVIAISGRCAVNCPLPSWPTPSMAMAPTCVSWPVVSSDQDGPRGQRGQKHFHSCAITLIAI